MIEKGAISKENADKLIEEIELKIFDAKRYFNKEMTAKECLTIIRKYREK